MCMQSLTSQETAPPAPSPRQQNSSLGLTSPFLDTMAQAGELKCLSHDDNCLRPTLFTKTFRVHRNDIGQGVQRSLKWGIALSGLTIPNKQPPSQINVGHSSSARSLQHPGGVGGGVPTLKGMLRNSWRSLGLLATWPARCAWPCSQSLSLAITCPQLLVLRWEVVTLEPQDGGRCSNRAAWQ